MKYENIKEGKFISRPNRFVAQVTVDGREVTAHVKNTGRCKELLVPGTRVFLQDFAGHMGTRKLRYSLIAVDKEGLLINMDSQAPNPAAAEAIEAGRLILPEMGIISHIQREKTYGDSRFDIYLEDEDGKRAFVEVKGVTLEEDGIVRFPDAPTERGIKHVRELAAAFREGYLAYILFVVQMKGPHTFTPNDATHGAFGDALRESAACGVHVLCYDCIVTPDSMTLDAPVKIVL